MDAKSANTFIRAWRTVGAIPTFIYQDSHAGRRVHIVASEESSSR